MAQRLLSLLVVATGAVLCRRSQVDVAVLDDALALRRSMVKVPLRQRCHYRSTAPRARPAARG